MSKATIHSLAQAAPGDVPPKAASAIAYAEAAVCNSPVSQVAAGPNLSRSKPARIPALDFTKGALVLIMVLYHWLNYFVSTGGFGYRYLRFLTPSFIFITGFFVSHIYLAKYDAVDTRLPKRLLERGLKLIAIFVGLNLMIGFVLSGSPGELLTNRSIYLTGNAIEGRAAFSVLLPIAYLLILSAGLVLFSRLHRKVFYAACLGTLLLVLISSTFGFKNAYVELVSIGLVGVAAGYLPIEKVRSIGRHPYALLMVYVVYLGAITLWNEIFAIQIVGVCLSVTLMFVLGDMNRTPGRLRRATIVLGQYSLLGYIAQIVVLQMLRRGLHHMRPAATSAAVALVAGIALTYLIVQAIDVGRKRLAFVNKLYSAVFA
jgi:peptidoglycan/LPS O-acetylase OafA/YrhL